MDVSARVHGERLIMGASLYIAALYTHYTLEKIYYHSDCRRQIEQKKETDHLDQRFTSNDAA